SGYPRAEFNGLNVQLELPHFVYLLTNQKWTRADIGISNVELDPSTGALQLVVENTGTQFGRIEGLEIRHAMKKISAPGFPLFPQGRRRIALHWDGEEKPDALAIRAHEFSFERKLPLTP